MRHQSRETAFKIIYQLDILRFLLGYLPRHNLRFFLRQSRFLRCLCRSRRHQIIPPFLMAVEEKLPEIDQIIERNTTGWHVGRMMSVDRNLLRLAVYEMLFSAHISPKGAINEAVDMAKVYGMLFLCSDVS